MINKKERKKNNKKNKKKHAQQTGTVISRQCTIKSLLIIKNKTWLEITVPVCLAFNTKKLTLLRSMFRHDEDRSLVQVVTASP